MKYALMFWWEMVGVILRGIFDQKREKNFFLLRVSVFVLLFFFEFSFSLFSALFLRSLSLFLCARTPLLLQNTWEKKTNQNSNRILYRLKQCRGLRTLLANSARQFMELDPVWIVTCLRTLFTSILDLRKMAMWNALIVIRHF